MLTATYSLLHPLVNMRQTSKLSAHAEVVKLEGGATCYRLLNKATTVAKFTQLYAYAYFAHIGLHLVILAKGQ